MKKVLVLTPDIMGEGGVANYYRILNLQEHDHVDYFYVNSAKKQNIVFKGLGLVFKYIQFLFIVGKYDLCHLNISLDFKSYYRDLGYVALIRLFGKKFMCFFHGWAKHPCQRVAQLRDCLDRISTRRPHRHLHELQDRSHVENLQPSSWFVSHQTLTRGYGENHGAYFAML